MMKLVKVLITPERLECFKKALKEDGFTGMTIMAVEGQVNQNALPHEHCDGITPFDLLPRIQIEMVVDYYNVDHVISTIVDVCRIEKIAQCRIMVVPVEKAIRVLKGEVVEEFIAGGSSWTASSAIAGMRSAKE